MKNIFILALIFAEVSIAGGVGSGTLGGKVNPNFNFGTGTLGEAGVSSGTLGNKAIPRFDFDQFKGRSPEEILKIFKDMKEKPSIVFYQGENEKDVFFNLGQPEQNQWKIKGIKMDKTDVATQRMILDALRKSYTEKDWAKILNKNKLEVPQY